MCIKQKNGKIRLCIAKTHPFLLEEWHPSKNIIPPRHVTSGSHKKVWWQCTKGHEWETMVHHRCEGSNCPYCIGKSVCRDNCLATINPELAKEWHASKNGELTPNDVVPSSHKKVWWQCTKGHEWETRVYRRSGGGNCPYCSHRKLCNDNCLATINPELAREWHASKNGELTPNDVMPSSHKKVWWQCTKGHEWETRVHTRYYGHGCPYCSGPYATDEICLATINPALAKEWHPSKNGELTPNDVRPMSNKKVWWQCTKGHEWEAVVQSRSRGSGCRYCWRRL